MSRRLQIIIITIACSFTVLPEVASAGLLQEGWYRMRSRDNMKIGNYAAAIEAYEKYLELRPDDREALKGIALAYEKQGETDKAIAHYDKYLAIYQNDAETAFKQANYLIWSRYAYRRKDAIKYFRMGLEIENDPQQRLKFAQLLAQDRNDLDRSVEQYQILLKQNPENEKIREEYRKLLLWDDRYLAEAIAQYEYYLSKKPNDFEAREQLAVLLGKSDNRKQEGIAIYAQLVSEKPNDFKLRHDYAKLMTSTPGNFDEARNQYKILVDRRPDNEIKTEAAQLLEQRKATRPEALKLYSEILKQEPGNRDIRMKRAALYMNEKSTASSALKDYQRIIEQVPNNAAAHQGAAKALAWLERPDDALYHANLARKYSKNDRASSRLHSELSRGREPRLTTFLELPFHDGDNYELEGTRLGLRYSGELTPYLSFAAEGGYEKYDSETDDASDTWLRIDGEYRMSPEKKLNVSLQNHPIRRTGDPLTFGLSYTHSSKYPQWSYIAGYSSSMVTDSFLSLVGDDINNTGGATRHELYVLFSRSDGSKTFTLRPAAGWVDSASESKNEFVNLGGSMRFPFSLKKRYQVFYGMDLSLMSYAKDHSGFGLSTAEPLSGGYFSPQKYIGSLLYVDSIINMENSAEFSVKLGPKFQLVDDASVSNDVSNGFFGSLSYIMKQSDTRYIILKAEHDLVGNQYKRTLLQGQMVFIF
jgi:tetratricopeptide (TPR) repeat protein